jgi:peroxin-4
MSSTSKRTSSSSSSRTPTKRILTELSAYNSSPSKTIIALAPISSSNVLALRAVLSGATLAPASGYQQGRFLLSIQVPPNYPVAPPTITFVTRVCHPNVKFETGEICLDVLRENWTPILGVVGALESVARLLGEPGTDSPLNVDVAALIRDGDFVGARGLVGFYCGEDRFEGVLEEDGR